MLRTGFPKQCFSFFFSFCFDIMFSVFFGLSVF